MTLKEMIKQKFSNPKDIVLERYKASKFIFVITAFYFFLSLYFVWANFYSKIFSYSLWISYVVLLISTFIYTYFSVKMLFIEHSNKYLNILLFILLFILFVILLLPIILKLGFFSVLEIIKFLHFYI